MTRTPNDYPRVQFRMAPALAGAIAARGPDANTIARRDLDRYYTLLNRALASVQFRLAEALLLADVTNGTLWQPESIPLLWAEVADAIDGDGAAEKWQLAGEDATSAEHFDAGARLIAKLRALTPAQTWAVVDALERAWEMTAPPDMRERLELVGLAERSDDD